MTNVELAGDTSYTFDVTYADDRGIETSSIDDGDILVSRSGGGVFGTSARLVSVDAAGNGTPRVATYQFTPPAGSWDFGDNGTYRLTLRPNQVRDTGNNTVGGRLLGSFQVAVPPPPSAANEFYVNSLLDSADAALGDGLVADAQGLATLRAAIMEANARTGDERIFIPSGTISLSIAGTDEDAGSTGDLDIASNIEIIGAGIDLSIIDGATLDRVIQVANGATVTLRGLTIRGGNVTGNGGGLSNAGVLHLIDVRVTGNTADGSGGGIVNSGTLRLVRTQVDENTSTSGAGGIHSAQSGATPTLSLDTSVVSNNMGGEVGGIVNDGPLTITNSTIADNVATTVVPSPTGRVGGFRNGLFNAATSVIAAVSASTISGNSATDGVGGLLNFGTLALTNSTISGNIGDATGGIDSGSAPLALVHVTVANNTGDEVGGVRGDAATVHNSIIATNVARTGSQPDVGSGPFTSLGHNVIGIEEGTTNFVHNVLGDQVGTLAEPLDPRLTELADWGGPTKTHALLATSPAIDAGENGELSEDQRGAERVLDGGGLVDSVADAGAFEFGTFFVNDTTDSVDAEIGDGLAVDIDGRHTLRAAIQEANATSGRSIVVVAAGRYSLTIPGRDEDDASTGDLDIRNPLTLAGGGRGDTVIDAQGIDRGIHVLSTDLDISDLQITGGQYDNSAGGGIQSQGNLVLRRVDLTDNSSAFGGAIYAVGTDSLIRIENSSLVGNRSDQRGGGIYADGSRIEILDSRIESNIGRDAGGGVYIGNGAFGSLPSFIQGTRIAQNQSANGGGIFFADQQRGLTITATSFEANTAIGSGGGTFAAGGAQPVQFQSSLFANNISLMSPGGGFYSSSGIIEFTNTTVSGNRSEQAAGGGVAAMSGSQVTLSSTTLTGNIGTTSGGLLIDQGGIVTLANSLIARNVSTSGSSGDVLVSSGQIESSGGNLIGDGVQGTFVPATGDLVGSSTTPLDPLLGQLQDNGGPTWTHALRTGSPAIDAGLSTQAATDARGVARALDGNDDGTDLPDIGAYEFEFGLPIRVEGIKFNDRNSNGVQNADEAVLANWTVFADLNSNGQLDDGEPTAVTDERGMYEFTGLDAGGYLIGEVGRPDWEQVLPGAGRIAFVPYGTVNVGDSVQAVVTVDLNRDGAADIVSADFGTDQISIVRGLGDGRFSTPVTVAIGRGPVDVIAADLDGDGFLDLATANFTGDSVTWLRNDGTGNLQVAATLAVGDGPRAIIAVDLDRDGDMDLVTADSLAGRISILRNDGAGNFTAAQAVAAGELPQDLIAADFDGDGDTDLAIVNLEAFTVTLLFNDDSGQLELFDKIDVGSFPRGIAAGDLDGDGDIDLVVTSSFSDGVSVLLNNGHGGFVKLAPDIHVGRVPRGIAIADVDRDGRPDLLVTNSGDDSVSVLRNLGLIANQSSTDYLSFAIDERVRVGRGPRAVAVADLDRDGNLDLVVANKDSSTLSVLRNSFGSYQHTFVAGDLFRMQNFGNRLLPGTLRGVMFHDLDADGVR